MANQQYDLSNSPTRIRRVFIGDTTESAAVKFDLSAFAGAVSFSIAKVKWACSTGVSVDVLFDRSTPAPARPFTLSGNGEFNDEIKDKGTGNTGDIQFTTAGTLGRYMVDMEVIIHK